ncbi:helix-turn-helix transcriptional regulator [Microvirga terricola]|uniref:LuxR family transcriptional regulator n=1 Tax=Microvirga terricola TaxID=2719797 RepID=A0ABX0VCU4_9HYPH|nr:LuxR family transcriptional regulator [Microvirga terricola]NIX76984.1 LuxR family transcriptional regulator [Microvirga terricola]
MAGGNSQADIVFEFVEACESFKSVDEVLSALRTRADDLGFAHFIVTGLPLPNRPLEPLVLLNSWPAGWFDRYISRDYFRVDPIGQQALATSTPFKWGHAAERGERVSARTMMGEAVEFGLTDGFCVPIYTATGWQSAISFASPHRLDMGPRDLAAAHLLAITAHGRLRVLLGEERLIRQRLTPREREVLTWAAAGKSAWETSCILSISEATVITHLDNVRRKLNVANTTQAVAVALQTGELQPY